MLTKDDQDFVLGLIDRQQKEPIQLALKSDEYVPSIPEQFLLIYLVKTQEEIQRIGPIPPEDK